MSIVDEEKRRNIPGMMLTRFKNENNVEGNPMSEGAVKNPPSSGSRLSPARRLRGFKKYLSIT
jgi:hypothetical protein